MSEIDGLRVFKNTETLVERTFLIVEDCVKGFFIQIKSEISEKVLDHLTMRNGSKIFSMTRIDKASAGLQCGN